MHSTHTSDKLFISYDSKFHDCEALKNTILSLEKIVVFSENDDMTIVVSLNNDATAITSSYGFFYEHGRCYTFRWALIIG